MMKTGGPVAPASLDDALSEAILKSVDEGFEAQLAIVEVRANYSHLTRSRPCPLPSALS